MIQRIQSIYLLLAAILMAVVCFLPLVNLGQEGLVLFSMGLKNSTGELIKPTWGIISISSLSGILAFIAIFLFKNRSRQRTVICISALTILLYFVTILVYLTSILDNIVYDLSMIRLGLTLPILAFIALILASRSIKKDDRLVKSLNRIR